MAELSRNLVRAAGGVVWRPAGAGAGEGAGAGAGASVEIALVHRPRYSDWSLPKGKLDPGEHPLVAAVREVHEETSIRGVPESRLPTIRYLTGEPDVDKMVEFWSMRAETWAPREPDHEITEVRWVPLPEAPGLLSYVHDRGVVRVFSEQPRITGVVVLVRHATAGERDQWPGRDEERPLDDSGHDDAKALAELLRLFAPTRIVSASPRRCTQTVEPLASALGLPVEVDTVLDEGGDPDRAAVAIADAAVTGAGPAGDAAMTGAGAAVTGAGPARPPVTVLCSQGKVIPPVLDRLTGRATRDFATRKGSGWLLPFAGRELISVDRIDLESPNTPGEA